MEEITGPLKVKFESLNAKGEQEYSTELIV